MVPILAVVLLLAGLFGLGLARTGMVLARRGAAQSAADAAALAGAAEGERAARSVAEANGARVLTYRTLDADVVVTVSRRGIRATARARWETTASGPGSATSTHPDPGRCPTTGYPAPSRRLSMCL